MMVGDSRPVWVVGGTLAGDVLDDGEVVVGETVNVRAMVAVLAHDVAAAVLVLEDADVTAQVAAPRDGGLECERAGRGVGHGDADVRVSVVGRFGMNIHDIFAGGGAMQHLRPLADTVGGEGGAVFLHIKYDAVAAPCDEIGGCITAHALEQIAVYLVLAICIPGVAEFLQTDAVQLGNVARGVVRQKSSESISHDFPFRDDLLLIICRVRNCL